MTLLALATSLSLSLSYGSMNSTPSATIPFTFADISRVDWTPCIFMKVQLFTDRITCFDKVIPPLLLSLFWRKREREKDTDIAKNINSRILVPLLVVVKYYYLVSNIVNTRYQVILGIKYIKVLEVLPLILTLNYYYYIHRKILLIFLVLLNDTAI